MHSSITAHCWPPVCSEGLATCPRDLGMVMVNHLPSLAQASKGLSLVATPAPSTPEGLALLRQPGSGDRNAQQRFVLQDHIAPANSESAEPCPPGNVLPARGELHRLRGPKIPLTARPSGPASTHRRCSGAGASGCALETQRRAISINDVTMESHTARTEGSAFPRLVLTTYLGYEQLAMKNGVCTSSPCLTLSVIYFKNSLVASFFNT
ncbi:uncharacterized protein LOC111936734 [Cyanistes caeruleus]|uniref:uncharacterized protein LOC111936734 n=1 Tax=Cyanistes caeruleus TaxID=156563 RepID=UPI000CDA2454|nr:uncharacterized protein LOC111936734 [Cyanistes caeruleus]